MTIPKLSDLGATNADIQTRTLYALTGETHPSDIYPRDTAYIPGLQNDDLTGKSPADFGLTIAQYIALLPSQYRAAVTSWSGFVPDDDTYIDTIAMQTASNLNYDRDVVGAANVSCAVLVLGINKYIVDRTITLNHVACAVLGAPGGTRYYGTTVQYRGANGTIDANKWVFDCYLYTELGSGEGKAPPGRVWGDPATDPKFIFRDVRIHGLNGGNSSSDQSAGHGYISGIRVRQAAFFQIENCSLDARLYDGVTFTGPQLFVICNRNWFGNIARDGYVNFRGPPGNNSTTQWIYNNEFIGVDRYGIFIDNSGGAVESMPVVRDNSFEHANTNSFYYNHPEWYVHGVVAWECFINCTLLHFDANRFEGGTLTTNYYGELHLVQSDASHILHNTYSAMLISSHRADATHTDAFGTFNSANNWCDITDQRNYNVASTANPGINAENNVIEHNYNSGLIYLPDNLGGAQTTANSIRDQSLTVMGVPTKDGTYARVVTPRDAAVPTLLDGLGLQRLQNVYTVAPAGPRYVATSGGSIEDYQLLDIGYGAWAADTAYNEFATQGGYVFRKPTTGNENGRFYQVIATTGNRKSHATTEPVWPTTIGDTIVDNHVTWKCVGFKPLDAEVNLGEISIFGTKYRNGDAIPANW